ncbi:MAG: hypothetical protein Q7Q73_17900, partial [Verrucomicrobiota bacterium JB024]|nr:hypothetical protein [Verrucomicrobiota bacterium JB024]
MRSHLLTVLCLLTTWSPLPAAEEITAHADAPSPAAKTDVPANTRATAADDATSENTAKPVRLIVATREA